MSSWGMEIRNGDGLTALDPDTFSVKLVETVWLFSAVPIQEFTVIDIPTSTNVLAGMFSAVTVNEKHYRMVGYPNLQAIYPWFPYSLPIVEIFNGFVRVRGQPIEESFCTGYLTISIMSYV